MLLRRHRKGVSHGEKRQSEARGQERQEVETKQEEVTNLTGYTVPELKEIARKRQVKGYYAMNKNQLITALE